MTMYCICICIYIIGRIRIAHVPYAKSLAMEKKKVAITIAKSGDDKEMNNKTTAQTMKGGVRIAHVPQNVSFNVKLLYILTQFDYSRFYILNTNSLSIIYRFIMNYNLSNIPNLCTM